MYKIMSPEYYKDALFRGECLDFGLFECVVGLETAMNLKFGETLGEILENGLDGITTDGTHYIPQGSNQIRGYDFAQTIETGVSAQIFAEADNPILELIAETSFVVANVVNEKSIARFGPDSEYIMEVNSTTHVVTHIANREPAPGVNVHIVKLATGIGEDGVKRKVDSNNEFDNVPYFNALFQKTLDDKLQERNYITERRGNAVALKALTEDNLREAGFMTRSDEIKQYMIDHNMPEEQRDLAARITAKPKQKIDPEQFKDKWQTKAKDLKYEGPVKRTEALIHSKESEVRKYVAEIASELHQKNEKLDKRELLTEALLRGIGQPVTSKQIHQEVDRVLDKAKSIGLQEEMDKRANKSYHVEPEEQKQQRKEQEQKEKAEKKPEEVKPEVDRHEQRAAEREAFKEKVAERMASKEERQTFWQDFKDAFLGLKVVYEVMKDHWLSPKGPKPLKEVTINAASPSHADDSLKKFVRGLEKTLRKEAHLEAIGSIRDQRHDSFLSALAYAEMCYSIAREPKHAINEKTTITILNYEKADPVYLRMLEEKAEKVNAKIVPHDPDKDKGKDKDKDKDIDR
jgi:conjugative relaxase-like TrwC/TraI family protein